MPALISWYVRAWSSRTEPTATRRTGLDPKRSGKPLAPPSDSLDAAKHELDRAVADFVNVGDAVREIYHGAPYKWYHSYKLEFEPKFESYCNAVLQSRPTPCTLKDVEYWLEGIVLDYPPPPKFMEHRLIVMDFSKMLHAVIESDPATNIMISCANCLKSAAGYGRYSRMASG